MTAQFEEKKIPSVQSAVSKTIAYSVLLAIVMVLMNFLFGWTTADEMPEFLQ